MSARAQATLAVVFFFAPSVASAEVERFALLIGNDRGDAQTHLLKLDDGNAGDRERDVELALRVSLLVGRRF